MPTVYLYDPVAVRHSDPNLAPVAGALLHTWVANTTTNQATYTDSTGTTPHPNPVVADSTGIFPEIWLTSAAYDMQARKSDDTTVLWNRVNVTAPAAAAAALQTSLAAANGSSLVGFQQAGTGAAIREMQTKTREVQVNAADYTGWDPTGAVVSDTAIQAAINYVNSVGGGTVWFPVSSATFSTVTPKSNVTLRGHGSGWHLRQIQPGTNIQTGFYKASGGGSVSNFHVRDLNIDGGRVSSPASVSNHIFSFNCGTGESVTDVSWIGCQFKNAQTNCVYIYASSSTSGVSECIKVKDCKAWTEDASLFEGTNKTACDLLRCEQTWDYSSGGNGYPNFITEQYVYFKHIKVLDNHCEKIRTCADLKRGCAFFTIANNTTKNMYDCHHSVDGAGHGTISGCSGEVEPTTTIASTFTNFIEVQGEHIVISSNTVNGGGLLVSGILATDYGRPAEGSNKGHQSTCVIQRDNIVRNVTTNGMRMLNGIGCSIEGGVVDTAGAHTATCESGGSRTAADGVTPLVAHGAFIGGIQSRNCTEGVQFTSAASTVIDGARYAPCPDENGEDFYFINSVAGVSGIQAAATACPFYNDQPPPNICQNGLLTFTAAGPPPVITYFGNTLTGAAASAGPPNGMPAATTLEDPSAAGVQGATYSATPLFSVGQRCYVTIAAKYNTATSWSVQIDELDSSSALINSYYYGMVNFNVSGTAWADYALRHTVVASTCVKLRFTINPAASFAGDGARVGKTDFANFRISRIANGIY